MQNTARELCERRAWGLELWSPNQGCHNRPTAQTKCSSRELKFWEGSWKKLLTAFHLYLQDILEQNVCLHIGLRYPDIYNLPILSDYVKFLRLDTLNKFHETGPRFYHDALGIHLWWISMSSQVETFTKEAHFFLSLHQYNPGSNHP